MPKQSAADSLRPLYVASRSLDINYHFEYCTVEHASVTVKGAETHASLYSAYKNMIELKGSLKYGTGRPVYTASWDAYNFATATLTFLYTDTTTEEGYLGEDVEQSRYSILMDPSERLLSSADMYEPESTYRIRGIAGNKNKRDKVFCELLEQRVENFSDYAPGYALPSTAIADVNALNEVVKGSQFHETYHHSEQAIMHYLSDTAGLQAITRALLRLNAAYVYGVVLDIYTQRSLCCNCNACLLGMQASHQNGFLADLSRSLESKRIQPRLGESLMLSTRVSASQACGSGANLDALRLPDDKNVVHRYDPDEGSKVFQAENRALGTASIIRHAGNSLPRYTGAFFCSTDIKGKAKLNDKLTQIMYSERS